LILATLPDSHLQESESDLDLDDETLDAFFRRLQERNVKLEFSSGDWAELARHVEESNHRYDLVLTAETIYRRESVPGLLRLLRASSIDASDRGSSGRRETPTTTCPTAGPGQRIIQLGSAGHLILIAAKVMYFGVGGDLHNFEQEVKAAGGSLLDVKTWESGVGRKVVRLQWS
jgi:protein-histidine N-methyltransferase